MPVHHGTGYESPAGLYVPDIVRVERVTSCGFIGVTNVTTVLLFNLMVFALLGCTVYNVSK